jgi:rRNA maturation protein Nop10
MFLQYYLNEERDWVYTLKKFDSTGQQTCSAHPARFSPRTSTRGTASRGVSGCS